MSILSATEDELVHTCLDQGMLVDMQGKICPTCKCGTLGPLSSSRRGVLNYQCNPAATVSHAKPIIDHGRAIHSLRVPVGQPRIHSRCNVLS
eukprot:963149-Amphidinium_carterae.2